MYRMPTQHTPVKSFRFDEADRAAIRRLGELYGSRSETDTVRRAVNEELDNREKRIADLLERIRDAGVSFGKRSTVVGAFKGERPYVKANMGTRREPHIFQDVGGRLIVAREGPSGQTEIAYLDGPEPDEPDVKFAREKVISPVEFHPDPPVRWKR